MQPKHYKPTDKLIQWAYFMEDVRPRYTSTCALFWRSTVLTPLKVLGPVALVGFFVTILTIASLNIFAPQYLPAWAVDEHVPSGPMTAADKRFLTIFFGVAIGLVAGIVIGITSGFFAWLHGLCLPVEIEGGLVQKGACPRCGTVKMILSPDDAEESWDCPKCHGYFMVHAPGADDDDLPEAK